MRILIINTDYPKFLRDLYDRNDDLRYKPYDEQLRVRNYTLFGSSDFYSYHLQQLDCKVMDVHFNNIDLQARWMQENNQGKNFFWKLKKMVHSITDLKIIKALGHRLFPGQDFPSQTFMRVSLKAQIQAFNPDIILNQSLQEVPLTVIKEIKNSESRLIGQIASPLPKLSDLKGYDLIISSLPNFVKKFADYGIPAKYVKLAFEERVLRVIQGLETNTDFSHRDLPIVFIGSITSAHRQRFELLEYLCKNTDIKIWGSLHNIPTNSPIYEHYMGEAWGIDMYKIFLRCKIVLNNHIDISENDANNMRMFEATGCGALLLTDYKLNLSDLFEEDKEVVAYRSFSECLEKIQFYLQHNDAAREIALAGQRKTLRDHTYAKRMQEMLAIFKEIKAVAAKNNHPCPKNAKEMS